VNVRDTGEIPETLGEPHRTQEEESGTAVEGKTNDYNRQKTTMIYLEGLRHGDRVPYSNTMVFFGTEIFTYPQV
jgi:hypothetical protein